MDQFSKSMMRMVMNAYGWRFAFAFTAIIGSGFVAGFVVGSAVN